MVFMEPFGAFDGVAPADGLEDPDELAMQNMMAAEAGDEGEEEEVEEHLKDSISGSMKLKRLLESEASTENGGPAKKLKVADGEVKTLVQRILMKWGLIQDTGVRYVLQQLPANSLQLVLGSNYMPDRNHMTKTPADIVNGYILQVKEREFPGGGPLDSVSIFKYQWKITEQETQMMRKLAHKELRYVLATHDGTRPVAEIIEEASGLASYEEGAAGAAPDGPGPTTIGRFLRLELIDPLGDALVLGDANLTFSVRLAEHRKALGHVGRIVATTFEQLPTLRERYPEIDRTIHILEEHYAEVWHEVDCTRLAVNDKFKGHEETFGAVYYNYPHSGAVRGFFDGHPFVRWRHENLMHLFFRALTKFVKPGGSVKVASNMGAVGVRYSDIIGGAKNSEFRHIETVPFTEWILHRYGRSYGDRRDARKRPGSGENYNAQKAAADMVYSFMYCPTGEKLEPPHFTCPPSRLELQNSNEGPLKGLVGPMKNNAVSELYERFVSEVKGVHVG